MIRHASVFAALGGTFVALIATSPAQRNDCVAEAKVLIADTTCGPVESIIVTSKASCHLTTGGPAAASFPASGYLVGSPPPQNASIAQGFVLEQYSSDGGLVTCTATPADAGFAIHCGHGCISGFGADGGTHIACNSTCSGALTP